MLIVGSVASFKSLHMTHFGFFNKTFFGCHRKDKKKHSSDARVCFASGVCIQAVVVMTGEEKTRVPRKGPLLSSGDYGNVNVLVETKDVFRSFSAAPRVRNIRQ